jgi:hypothetical protein
MGAAGFLRGRLTMLVIVCVECGGVMATDADGERFCPDCDPWTLTDDPPGADVPVEALTAGE